MTRMRESMPVILFGLLIAFLITIIFEWGMDYLGMRSGGQNAIIGSVDGKDITLQEFSQLVETVSSNQKQQSNVEPDENQMKQTREQVWQQLVTQRLVDDQIKKLGLSVTDQEIIEWVRGENPPEDLKRNFIDSTGTFRRDVYDQFLRDPNQFVRDPNGVDNAYGTKWLADFEKNLRQRKLQEKLQSLVTASVRVGELEVRKRFEDQNVKYDASFALFDPNVFVKDEEVVVSDSDVKAFYDENLESYKFEASRKLTYVTFSENPSSADSASKMQDIQDALQKAKAGADFIQLVDTYSDKADSGAWFKHGELSQNIESIVFSAKVGDVVGPMNEFDGYHIIKLLDERKGDKEFVRASHILFQISGPDSNAVKATAQSVARQARAGGDFAALAVEHSKDASNAPKGGDLGWFGKGRMVPQFEEACFKARIGEIVGPVRTAFGLHIIKLTGRDSREVKIASIISKLVASSQTRNDIADRAKDFSANARESDFATEAKATGLETRETEIQEKGGVIPGLGVNKGVTKWAFNNKVGSVSDPFTIPNGWAVFAITDAKDAGVRPFEELKESLKPQVLRKNKIERLKGIAAAMKSKLTPSDSLGKLHALDSRVQVQRTNPFLLSAGAPGVGRDMTFFGTVEGLQAGQISDPFAGLRGVFLVQLVSKTPIDSVAYASQRETLRSQLLQEKRGRYISEWLAKLKETADIEDNRDSFYR
jgi:parvulin-like peptidyl-prolyl isomerase